MSETLDANDPLIIQKLTSRVLSLEARLEALTRRKPSKSEALDWARRRDVSDRFRDEVRARVTLEQQGHVGDASAPALLMEAKRAAGSWKELAVIMGDGST